MPTVTAQGQTFACPQGVNLRRVLLDQGIDLYNGQSQLINCHGLGTCGTCAVEVIGAVSEQQIREIWRLSLPPHALDRGLRLACQTQVIGDVKIRKFEGFWGHQTQVKWNH